MWPFKAKPAPETWVYRPQEDITAFELSRVLGIIIARRADLIKDLPENCRRHFRLVDE